MSSATLVTVTNILIGDCGIDRAAITPASNFTADLGLDSLDAYELILRIEEQFDLVIPEETIHRLPTVGDMVRYLDAHADVRKLDRA